MIKIPRFPTFEPRRSTYTAHFVGGEFDGKSLAMYGKTSHEPRPYIDFAEHVGNEDGTHVSNFISSALCDISRVVQVSAPRRSVTFIRKSNFYVLAEPVKRVGVGCPAFIYQYQPDFVPPSKQETPSFA